MDYFQCDKVGILLVTVIIPLIIWYVAHYRRQKTKVSKSASTQTINKCVKKKVVKIQTSEVTTNSAQTETMRFTERLTNYGDKKVDLHDKFDRFCEICEANSGSEAVGFCKMCEKFLCFNCCKYHEKIPLSHGHVLLGKDKFNKVRNKKKLFEKKFALLNNLSFNNNKSLKYSHNNQLLCLAQNLNDVWHSIECCVLREINQKPLTMLWQEQIFGNVKEKVIMYGNTPAGICTFKCASQKCFGWYITVPDQQKLYKYTNDAGVNFICTSGNCYGLAVFNGGLAISLEIETSFSIPEWQIQFISYEGIIYKQICYDNEEEPLFKEPKHLTSNDAKDILFVSDHGNHSVIALDIKGYVLFKYTHETIKSPHGITCDDEGNIYVASGNKVVQIDQHGTKSRVILSSKENQSKMVIDVCYNKFTSELGVLSESSVLTLLKPLP